MTHVEVLLYCGTQPVVVAYRKGLTGCWMDVRKRIAVLVAETEWAMVDQKRAVLEEALDGGDAIRQALIEPVEYIEDEKSNRVRECSARDVLASLERRTRGIIQLQDSSMHSAMPNTTGSRRTGSGRCSGASHTTLVWPSVCTSLHTSLHTTETKIPKIN